MDRPVKRWDCGELSHPDPPQRSERTSRPSDKSAAADRSKDLRLSEGSASPQQQGAERRSHGTVSNSRWSVPSGLPDTGQVVDRSDYQGGTPPGGISEAMSSRGLDASIRARVWLPLRPKVRSGPLFKGYLDVHLLSSVSRKRSDLTFDFSLSDSQAFDTTVQATRVADGDAIDPSAETPRHLEALPA